MNTNNITYRVWLNRPSLPENTHRSLEVRLECRTNRDCEVTEARQDRDLDIAIQNITLKVLEEHAHEGAAVLRSLVAESARDIADDTDSNRAELRILVRLECRIEMREERRNIGSKALFEGSRESADNEEGVLKKCRSLARSVDELKDESHDTVRKRLDAVVEFPDDALQVYQSVFSMLESRVRLTVITPQKLVIKSFQLLRSSTPTIWFCQASSA